MAQSNTNNFIQTYGSLQGNRIISTVNTGTSPIQVASTTLVTNLNADQFGSNYPSFYTNANNISSGTLSVARGGTGFSSLTTGYIPFGNSATTLSSSANLFWDSTNNRLGISTTTPSQALHVAGNILSSSNISATNQIISTVTTGTAPITVASTTLVANLNVQQLNSQSASYYTNATNISSGTLSVAYGGTGLNSITPGYVPFGSSSTTLSSSANLFWDSTNNRLGLNTNSPGKTLDVVGNARFSNANDQLTLLTTSNGTASEIKFLNSNNMGWAIGQNTFTVPLSSFGIFNRYSSQVSFCINSNDNIGIGNTSPSYKLDIVGDVNITGNYRINGTLITSVSLTQGYIAYGTGTSYSGNSNLFWDSTNNRLGVGTSSPVQTLHVSGNILSVTNITTNTQFISTISTGTAPISVASTTLVSNLNVASLNSQPGSYYLALSNATGTLPVTNGGTGLTSLTAGYIPFGSSATALNSSSNLFWDSTNSRLGINNTSPNAPLSVAVISTAPTPETTGFTCYASNQSFPAVISCRQALGGYSSSAQTAYFSTDWAGVTGASWSWGISPNSSSNAITFDFKKSWNFAGSPILSMSSITGFIGINNSSPTQQLHVIGNIFSSSNILASSRIGIGYTSPFSPLSVSNVGGQPDNSGISSTISNSSASPVIALRQYQTSANITDTKLGYLSWDWANYAGFSIGQSINGSANISNLTLDIRNGWDFSGNTFMSFKYANTYIGINNNNPTATLDVQGSILVSGNNTVKGQGLHLQWNRGTNDGVSYIMNQRAGAVGGMRFGEVDSNNVFTSGMALYNGSLGIGTIAPGRTLDVNGSINSATGYFTGGWSTVTGQGVSLTWNRNGAGEAWIINQRGGGSGSIRFAEQDPITGVISTGMTLSSNVGNLEVVGQVKSTGFQNTQPIYIVMYLNSNVPMANANGTQINMTNIPQYFTYSSGNSQLTNSGFTSSSFMTSSGITFPVAGIYSIMFNGRFTTSQTENAIWFSTNGTYKISAYSEGRIAYSSTPFGGFYASFTGYFASAEVIVPCIYSSGVNSFLANYCGCAYINIQLLYKC